MQNKNQLFGFTCKTHLWSGEHRNKSSKKKNANCINFRALVIIVESD
jgi:hypothetical protein